MISRLYLRLLSVALLVLFLPVAGIFTLQSFERELLAAEERAMAIQAATLSAGLARLEPFDAATARRLVDAVPRPLAGRIRVVARDGAVLSDTATALAADAGASERSGGLRDRLSYRIGAFLWRARNLLAAETGAARGGSEADAVAIARALAGGYGAVTRASADGTATVLTVATPVRAASAGGGAAATLGAVVVSRTTDTVLAALDRVRVDLIRIVALSVVATVLIALLLARGLVAPLLRLRDAADRALRPATAERAPFPESARRDEIGDLARALAALHDRLDRRIGQLEGFASDVAHEVRNPLAAIRAAVDLLPESPSVAERARLLALIGAEVRRVDDVVSALLELARIDRRGEDGAPPSTELGPLVDALAASFAGRPARIEVERPRATRVAMPVEAVARTVENLLDNALTFAPAGSVVRMRVRESSAGVELLVSDEGPGVPDEHRERVFERFFSWRPETDGSRHLGLGLALARALMERWGGAITLEPPTAGGAGATFRLFWPRADADGALRRGGGFGTMAPS